MPRRRFARKKLDERMPSKTPNMDVKYHQFIVHRQILLTPMLLEQLTKHAGTKTKTKTWNLAMAGGKCELDRKLDRRSSRGLDHAIHHAKKTSNKITGDKRKPLCLLLVLF